MFTITITGYPPLLGAAGVTIGRHIFYDTDTPSATLVRHELVHVKQYAQYGVVGFLTRYFYHYLKGRIQGLSHWDAYYKIPFEIEAYKLEKEEGNE